jgi:hypothetical protein
MAINFDPKYSESTQTYLRTIASDRNRQIVSPHNKARRGGLICNLSRFDLLVWFGSNPPVNSADWLVLPYGSNCDIPLFFTGDIYGFWVDDDNKTAKIYEFYGA